MVETLTQERLKELLDYDPETGVFRWKVRRPHTYIGACAGYAMKNGYIAITLLNRHYYAHRLVWFWLDGAWPTHQIDHRNGVRSDNRLVNLRDASSSQQNQNLAKSRRNSSGYRGVCFDKARGQWVSRLGFRHLGRFSTPEAARDAYLSAKTKFHPFQPTPRDA